MYVLEKLTLELCVGGYQLWAPAETFNQANSEFTQILHTG